MLRHLQPNVQLRRRLAEGREVLGQGEGSDLRPLTFLPLPPGWLLNFATHLPSDQRLIVTSADLYHWFVDSRASETALPLAAVGRPCYGPTRRIFQHVA